MIIVAPDKFKGTLSARQAANVIAEALKPLQCVKLPMADGGEGTAAAIATGPDWEMREGGYFVNASTRTAVIDSSSVIGTRQHDLLRASSAPLGVKVREIIKGGCDHVIICIGGTATCDGGEGFLTALSDGHRLEEYRDKLIGLCDVMVPLLPAEGDDTTLTVEEMQTLPSTLMFAKQKGALDVDYPVLWRKLDSVRKEYGKGRESKFDGAGGGLGFALASAIEAPCYQGAKYVLDHYNPKWDFASLVITGEGSIDSQTFRGKVVAVVAEAAWQHEVPCLAIGGKVENATGLHCAYISADEFLKDEELTSEIAANRIRKAIEEIKDFLPTKQYYA